MTDIVERLRETLTGEDTDEAMWQRIVRERREAADEIERLRDQIYESIPKWQANELQREIERLRAKVEAEKTPRHPAEDARDFWHAEATRLLGNLDKARRELADLERHFGKAIADNTALAAEVEARVAAARREGIEAAWGVVAEFRSSVQNELDHASTVQMEAALAAAICGIDKAEAAIRALLEDRRC